MCSNLSDYQLNIDCYTHRMLYVNVVVTTSQNPIIDKQKIESNLSHSLKKSSIYKRKEEENREL